MPLKNYSSLLFLTFACISLLFSPLGCQRGTDSIAQQIHYHKDGRAKPRVVLTSVVDHTRSPLPWSLAQEFTSGIENRILRQSNLFLMHNTRSLTEGHFNPFLDDNYHWIKESAPEGEFVVFMELSEHTLVPKTYESLFNIKNSPAYDLHMNIRIKVVDIRHQEPKVILQEVFQETYHIPWQLAGIDYTKTTWGNTGFFISPMGLAHAQLMKKVTQQIEDYVLLAQTHS